MEHPRTGTSLQQRDSSCVEPDPRKRGSAEGSEGHVKAEVEKGLHVKQQLAAWKISKALRKDQSDLFGSRGATAFRVQGGPWGGGSSGFSRVSEASGVSVPDLGWVMDSSP